MALDQVFRLTAQFTMPESTIQQWVWHIIQTTVGDVALTNLIDAAEVVLADAWAEIEDQHTDGMVGDTLELAVYDDVLNEFNTVRSNDISALVGTDAVTDMLPHQDAGLVLFFTSVGRSLGKKFISGMVETTQADSIVAAAAIVKLILFAAEFKTIITAAGNDYAPGNFNLVSEVFRQWGSTVSVGALISSQDKRKPGIGI